jgi:SAM-dependent methyltransferase
MAPSRSPNDGRRGSSKRHLSRMKLALRVDNGGASSGRLSSPDVKRSDWEAEAANWIGWARAPQHDSYHEYGPSFLEDVVPAAGARTLDLGCGEGRVSRDLQRLGHPVIGVDASPTLIGAAAEAGPGPFLLADAARLPLKDSSFDLVVAYNVLMDFDDLTASVTEVARILRPGGRFAVCVLHPLAEAGKFEAREPDAPFVIEGSYFEHRHYKETFSRQGLTMTFSSSTYPLESYFLAFESAGLPIEMLREPRVPDRWIEQDAAELRWARIPLFLFLRAVKPA